ncbi:glycosyltransferase family 2 protein [Allofournierella sp.]|uniref:glycosyltransferase family 2 protein n=1 Tax=Allofournierella sp. TaxID=1940256 RepID=UPI002E7AAA47|nr:glycosyltransferase [Fournierella sp.]MEE0757569.1 glycosyltransferase [Fournierella sp.]
MAQRPFFTILTPVYKGVDFVPGCVESVRAQGFADYEHLLIDDGSPDESGEVCDRLAETDGRIRVIHQKNSGVTGARNAGIAAAKGQYLLFLDQDDRLGPCALAAIAAALKDAGEDLVSWRHHDVWEEMCADAAEAVPTCYAQPQFGRLYRTGTVHYVWTKAFPVGFLLEKGLRFDETIRDGTDDLPFVVAFWRAWFTAHPAAGIRYIPQPLYYYEMHNDASVSNRPQPFLPSHLAMFSNLSEDFLCRYHVPPAEMGFLWYQCLHTLAYGVLSTPPEKRVALKAGLLQDRRFAAILRHMGEERVYSPYYLPFRRGQLGLVAFIARSFEGDRLWFWRAYRLGRLLLGRRWHEVF